MIPVTAQQAAAIATIKAIPNLKPLEAHSAWVRFMSHTPFAAAPSERQRDLMQDTIAYQIGAKLTRLKAHDAGKLARVVAAFTLARNRPTSRSGNIPTVGALDMLGTLPDDPAGQYVLLYVLAPVIGYCDLAKAFSIPFPELGERLMFGELIAEEDTDLLALAAEAREREYD